MSSSAARTSRTARYAAASARNLAALTRPTRASLQPRRHLAALTKAPGRTALYDPMHERDNCGVGLVADLNKKPSRVILTDCNEMLVRMSHRGGCGCDPQSGDGAGMLVAMPDAFMRKHSGFELPAQGDYAVAMCFLPQEEANAAKAAAVASNADARALASEVEDLREQIKLAKAEVEAAKADAAQCKALVGATRAEANAAKTALERAVEAAAADARASSERLPAGH